MAEMSHPEAQAEGSSQASASESREVTATRDEGTKDPRPVYEIGFHIVPGASEADVAGIVEKLRAEIGTGGAEIIIEQFPSKLTLAYTIERSLSGKREKFTEAYFGWIKFATEREFIPALERMLRDTREILRYLLVETVREEAIPRRAIYTSDRLEGETIKKPVSAAEESKGPISEEELEKSIEALTQ